MIKTITKIVSIVCLCSFVLSTTALAQTNSSARTGQALQVVSAAANGIQGKVYMAECQTSTPSCVLGVLSFVQAAMMVASALQSNKTKDASECTGQFCGGTDVGGTLNPTFNPTNPTNPATGNLPGDNNTDLLARIQDDASRGLQNLSDRGYSYDAATNSVKTPGGSVAASSLSSSDGLKGLGMSDADIAKMNTIGKDALKEAQKFVDGFDIGGGGGGKKSQGNGDPAFDMNKYLAGLAGKKPERGVAGLEKKYGSDHIGIAQDNIFKMINRRYEAKKSTLTP